MGIDQRVISRLDELIATSTKPLREDFPLPESVAIAVDQWAVSTLSLLRRVFGEDSEHYGKFSEEYDNIYRLRFMAPAVGILRAAREDYANGYLFDIKQLVVAEVFDDLLDQAQYLFEQGYHQPAAVLAGGVLEDSLRKLCSRRNITLPSKPKLS